jgi:hypothetical protein
MTRSNLLAFFIILALGLTQSLPVEAKTSIPFAYVEDVPDGTAVVYVFKRKMHGKLIHAITVNGKLVGALRRKRTYFPLLVRPGELRFSLTLMTGAAEDWGCPQTWGFRCEGDLVINVEAGKKYFVMDTGGAFSTKLVVPDARTIEKVLLKSRRGAIDLYDGFYEADQADLFIGLALELGDAGRPREASTILRRSVPHFEAAAARFMKGSKSLRRSRVWRQIANAAGPFVAQVQARMNAKCRSKNNFRFWTHLQGLG